MTGEAQGNGDGSAEKDYRELRLAVVCYGGVSLAIYMHGLTKELHRLAIASAEREPGYVGEPEESGSVPSYVAMLKHLAELDSTRTRVVIDVISGTSAGGMNGVCLARALAGDRTQESLTRAWLEKAQFTDLLSPEVIPFKPKAIAAYPHIKNLYPRIDTLLARDVPPGAEGVRGWRRKWELFQVGRILRKPALELVEREPHSLLSGDLMSELVATALSDMARRRDDGASLVPGDHPLDLFVTTTDFAGARTKVSIEHEPVDDQRYRALLHFTSNQGEDYDLSTDDGLPVLGFATRATSSFPSAFPPISLNTFTTDQPADAMVGHFFRQYVLEGSTEQNPESEGTIDKTRQRLFFDGGILDNWPFDHAIEAIANRLADSEVDRRLLYLEPDPMGPPPPEDSAPPDPPALLATLQRGASDIPLSQSLGEALQSIRDRNELSQRLVELVDQSGSIVAGQITVKAGDLLTGDDPEVDPDAWNSAQAALHWGIDANPGYLRLKLSKVVDGLADRICTRLEYPKPSSQAWAVRTIARQWAVATGLLVVGLDGQLSADQVGFLQAYDLGYMERRLRFTRDGVSLLYGADGAPSRTQLNRAKKALSERMELLREIGRNAINDEEVAGDLEATLGMGKLAEVICASDPHAMAVDYAGEHAAELDALSTRLSGQLGPALDGFARESFVTLRDVTTGWGPAFRSNVLTRYLGFPLWDSLTYAITVIYGVGERDRVGVVRVSPRDARLGGEFQPDIHIRLKGTLAHHFGAFYYRESRENDYVWGRLDGAEQLVRLLAERVPPTQQAAFINTHCNAVLHAILAEESDGDLVTEIGELMADVDSMINAVYPV